MKKSKYFIIGIALLAALGGCSKDSAKEDAKRAEESSKKVEETESETFVFKEENGEVILTKYNGTDPDVEIPEEYNDKPVTAIADTAFEDSKQLESITIPYTVQRIYDKTLPEQSGIHLNVYQNTMGELYAMQRGLECTILGENPMQATTVIIYNKDGSSQETLSIGNEPKEDFAKGISFREADGKSVLTLDNCDTGSIVSEEFAALTIELKEGSVNTLTGEKGNDGISCMGSLTITGSGSLNASGSNVFTLREGEKATVGSGVYVYGDLTIENHVQLTAKAGSSKSRISSGITIEKGTLAVTNSRLEAYGPTEENAMTSGAVLIYIYDEEQGDKLKLTNAQLVEGGQIVPVKTEDYVYGYSIGNGADITFIEDVGYEGMANYIRIEPVAQN